MLDHCPGAANLRTPTLVIRKCPRCGEEIEVFSNDISVNCSRCGFTVYNDILSCVQWCRYAKECVGEETYRKLTAKKPGDSPGGNEKPDEMTGSREHQDERSDEGGKE